MELRKIVVGVDFSPASDAAIGEAVALAHHTGAELVLVHVGAVLDSTLGDAPAGLVAEYHKHIPGEPMVQEIHLTKGLRVFVMQCGFHAYMESWGLAVDNPYFALTDQSGRFEIGDIPPGTYNLMVWHPQAKTVIEQQVTIPAKGTVTADFTIQPREGARAGMDTVENPRFGLGILGNREIKPTLELQQP